MLKCHAFPGEYNLIYLPKTNEYQKEGKHDNSNLFTQRLRHIYRNRC